MADAPSGATGPDQSPTKPKGKAMGFLSTTTGRVVVAGIALFVAVVVVGAIAFFVLFGGTKEDQTPLTPAGTGAKSSATTQTVTPTSPPEAPLDDTFTFRNIFAPSVKPPAPPKDTSADSGSSETSGTGELADTLVLESIATESGERVATFTWNGARYEVKEGGKVDDSPWQVITIYSDSVLMLYGDSKITLTVGQGFQGGSSSSK